MIRRAEITIWLCISIVRAMSKELMQINHNIANSKKQWQTKMSIFRIISIRNPFNAFVRICKSMTITLQIQQFVRCLFPFPKLITMVRNAFPRIGNTIFMPTHVVIVAYKRNKCFMPIEQQNVKAGNKIMKTIYNIKS